MEFLKKEDIFINFRFLIPLVIIFSSLKLFGYVLVFFLYIPYLILNREKLFYSIKQSNLVQKKVLIYLTILLFSIIYGAYFIKDIRIFFYWVPLVLTIILAYFDNIYYLKNNFFYRENYYKIIYNASSIYFIFYFLMNIFAFIKLGNFFKVQDNLWMGSSGAFAISGLYFYSKIKLWKENGFNLYSKFYLNFLFFILVVQINESRLGLVYIILFTFYLFIRNIQLKKYLNMFLITAITISFYLSSSFYIQKLIFWRDSIFTNSQENFSNLNMKKFVDSRYKFIQRDGRKKEIFKGFNKFKDYPRINKIIGTGWYSSRITIDLKEDQIKPLNYKSNKVSHLQGFIALILDTGLFGMISTLYLYLLNTHGIFKNEEDLLNRIFFLMLLLVNFLCLFIGYPFVNIAYFLFMLPNGIIQFAKVKEK